MLKENRLIELSFKGSETCRDSRMKEGFLGEDDCNKLPVISCKNDILSRDLLTRVESLIDISLVDLLSYNK